MLNNTVLCMRSRAKTDLEQGKYKRLLTEFIILLLACYVFSCIFKSAHHYVKPIDIESIPLIKKALDIKVQPDAPSGLLIPHQNKSVYNNLKSTSDKKRDIASKTQDINIHRNTDILMMLKEQSLHEQNKSAIAAMDDPFSVLTHDAQTTTMFLGFASTEAAATTRIQKLLSQYPELKTIKFKILKNKNQYSIQSAEPVELELAQSVCSKINSLKEICHMQHVKPTR